MQIEPNVKWIFITPNPEKKIEYAARMCYNSTHKITDNSHQQFLKSIMKKGHLSVIEHAYASFEITCSRSASHQIVRHRIASYSQKSQRYVNEKDFDYILPQSIKNKNSIDEIKDYMLYINILYQKLKSCGVKNEDARCILPNATATNIVMTANFREWLHFLRLRLDTHAQEEIRFIANAIHSYLMEAAPTIFNEENIK